MTANTGAQAAHAPTAVPARYMRSVIPHIVVRGASSAIEFYKRAFDAVELVRIARPAGEILHAEIRIEESILMIGDPDGVFHDPASLGGSPVGLHLYVADVDARFAQAVAAGAKTIQPVQNMFYGDRTGMLQDPFGHIWVLLTRQEDLTLGEIKTRGEALLRASDH